MSETVEVGDLLTQQVELAADYSADPRGWVEHAYPWGEGQLKGKAPHDWQLELLDHIGEKLRAPRNDRGSVIIRTAIASGHGIGKSTVTAWLVDWAMSTMPLTRCALYSNTETQLKQKTGGELNKWQRMSVTRDWFNITPLSLYRPGPDKANWRADLVPWSEHKSEAVAGLHNEGRRIVMIMDEASSIPRAIWESLAGALTDPNTEIIWCVFGNPTRNTGPFAECFKAQKELWHNLHIDARTVPGAPMELFKEWADTFGEDSDFFKVRCKGEFPSSGGLQFISDEIIAKARTRVATSTPEDPLIIGIDVARRGESRSVLYMRQGRDAKSKRPIVLPKTDDSMLFATFIADKLQELQPDAVFVDGGGIGGPVCDRLKQLGWDVIEVQFGGRASNNERYANKRAEMWSRMKDWLIDAGSIWDHYSMDKEFTVADADTDRTDRVLLESKDSLIERGEESPDIADALALTFAYPVVSRNATSLHSHGRHAGEASTKYDMYHDEPRAFAGDKSDDDYSGRAEADPEVARRPLAVREVPDLPRLSSQAVPSLQGRADPGRAEARASATVIAFPVRSLRSEGSAHVQWAEAA